MDLLATVPELEARLGRELSENEMDRALAVLEDASALVRVEVGDTIWTDSVTLATDLAAVPSSVRSVVLRSAERAMRNPGGYSSESSGDYSFQRNAVQGSGAYLTEAELKIIRKAAKKIGLWTQPVTRGDTGFDTVFVVDQYGGDWIPYDVYRAP